MKKVLVTDASQRKSVPIIRALGKEGITVLAAEDCHQAMGFYSKFTTRKLIYPSPENERAFVDWLIEHAKAGLFDILFPIDERTMGPVTAHKKELSKHMTVPVAEHDCFRIARNKASTMAHAASIGIPVPKTIFIDQTDNLEEELHQVPLPAVIKARESSGSRGLCYVFDRTELINSYSIIHRQYPFPIIQQYIPPGGDTLGVELLYNNGKKERSFVHRRLREFPVKGGPSTLRESVIRPDLVDYASKLLDSLQWHGVAMVEFMEDPTNGKAYLIEINAKFWGSIALPIAAGVNFPLLLYKLAGDEIIPPDPGYKEDILCRWLIPGDILQFLSNPDRFRLKPSFFQFRGMHYDLVDRHDMGPLFGMFVNLLSNILKPSFWKEKILR
jgi:predicted ATP-grasp superfamily ATP-dependent carboligase